MCILDKPPVYKRFDLMNKEELLNQLNQSQREAVEYTEGPSLVIAGAGSGKTRVLTYKIAYLIQLGIKPWNILALTFTNKAANEMKSRIGKLVGNDNARYINMGTFHSVFSHILRLESSNICYSSQFTIYDESDSRSLINTIVKEFGLDEKMYKPASVHSRISMAKNNLINEQLYFNDAEIHERDRQSRMSDIGKIYVAYQQRCKTANAMDFDDLLMLTYKLFQNNEAIRKKWADKFQYILVDEYQDTNKVQQMIIEQLSRENQRVCVVGDDAQSIYAFRGANIDNILEFNKIYKNAKLFKLEQNYRSTQIIVQAANSLIKHNKRQIPKDIFSKNVEGERLVLKPAYSDKEEASIVCNDIKRIMRTDNIDYSDFAILYRTNAQSRSFEEVFIKQGLPYQIYGGISFYQRKEIKDVIAYFRLVSNLQDEEAFKRIINYPARGIGNTTITKISDKAHQFDVSLWNVCSNPENYNLDINHGTKKKLLAFTEMISSFAEKINSSNAYTLGKEIILTSGIHTDIFSSTDPDYISRQENINEFLSSLDEFVESMKEEGRDDEATLSKFIQDVALITDKDNSSSDDKKITMMTVHSAKGLEFSTVFIVGLEENLFPSNLSTTSVRELEEERRLLYVAITRAEQHCILTFAKNRWRYGKMEIGVASRFLAEIDPKYLTIDGEPGFGFYSMSKQNSTSYNSNRRYDSDNDSRGFSKNQYSSNNSRLQNSRPVADQFRADAEYKLTSPSKTEQCIDPFSPSFHRKLNEARSNNISPKGARAAGFREATKHIPSNFKRVPKNEQTATSSQSLSSTGLFEGATIEHQRFGVGTITKLEGSGDDAKATVEFRNTGIKQLLIKFAKFTIIK